MVDIENYIKNNIEHNQYIINNNKFYSVKSLIIKLLLKSGLILDYAYPYILSLLILLNSSYFKNNKPFISENKNRIMTEEIYDNHNNFSTNINQEEFISNKDLIIYTSPYEFIDNKYVYNKVTFTISVNYLNKNNIPLVLKMDYEDLLLYFNIHNQQVIYKDTPDEEAKTITIIYHSTKNNQKEIVKNNLNTLLFVTLVFLNGLGIKKIDKIIIKSKIKDKLNELDNEPIIYGKNEIYRLNEIIENEKNNLEYINNKQDKPKLRIK